MSMFLLMPSTSLVIVEEQASRGAMERGSAVVRVKVRRRSRTRRERRVASIVTWFEVGDGRSI